MMEFRTVRVRLWQLIVVLALIAIYLCSGAAWKVWMVLRHPPSDSSISTAIQRELRPYKGVPVGYALGLRFGQFAGAMRVLSQAHSSRNQVRIAANTLRHLASTPGSWQDVALYELASLEARAGWLSEVSSEPSRTLIIFMDAQRWGRSASFVSSDLGKAQRHFFSIVQRDPDSPVSADALAALSELENAAWRFRDGAVLQVMAASVGIHRYNPPPSSQGPDGSSTSEDASLKDAARRLLSYLKLKGRGSGSNREKVVAALSRAGATQLMGWVESSMPRDAGGERPGIRNALDNQDRPLDATFNRSKAFEQYGAARVRVTARNQPLPGIPIVLLDPLSLRATARSGAISRLAPVQSGSEIAQTVQDLNPARPDDPLNFAATALVSPAVAQPLASTLPYGVTGPGGAAVLENPGPLTVGSALLVTWPGSAADLCLDPGSSAEQIRLVPRVHVLKSNSSNLSAPLIRWKPYPGADHYLVALLLEAPPPSGALSVGMSPAWSKHTAWWRDNVRGTSIRMDPGGFVGPASELKANGLWIGEIYRVVIVAQSRMGAPIASSIGLMDHPEEFFAPALNWLALRSPDSRVPAREAEREFRIRLGRRERKVHFRAANDPLENVIEIARSLAPPVLPGNTTREATLSPAVPNSSAAVRLFPLPGIRGEGRGLMPLAPPAVLPGGTGAVSDVFSTGGPGALMGLMAGQGSAPRSH